LLTLSTLLFSAYAIDSARMKTIVKSAIVPGMGQVTMGKNHGYVFMGNEVILLSGLYYFHNESDLKLNKAYDMALHDAHIKPGKYSDDYLAKVGKYSTNGFDVNGYNTSVREHAILLYPGDTQAQQDYFNHNMIPDSQGWSWDTNADRKKYTDLRKQSLDMKDYTKVVTGMIIANHLINLIDIGRITAQKQKMNVGFIFTPDLTPELQISLHY